MRSRFALALLALVLWCGCTLLAQRVGAYGGVSVRWSGEEGMTPSQVLRYERYAQEDGEQHPPSATLWREKAKETVALEGGNSATVTVTELFGAAGELYPLGFITGGWPARGDTQGCALDEETALRLWGSAEVVGLPLTWEGRTYLVRGVFRGQTSLLVTQGEENGECKYPGLLLRFSSEGGREAALRYLNAAGVTGGDLLDLDFLAWGLGAMAALPGLLMAGGMLLRIARRGWYLRTAPLLLAQYAIPALAGVGAAFWAAGLPAQIPGRLIPTRFSDFAFWTRLLGELGETVTAQLSRVPTAWDLTLWRMVLLCAVLGAGTLVVLIPGLERFRASSGRALLLGALGAGAAVFALAALWADAGGFLPTRGMWLLPTLWLLYDRCLGLHAQGLTPRKGGLTHALDEAKRAAEEQTAIDSSQAL